MYGNYSRGFFGNTGFFFKNKYTNNLLPCNCSLSFKKNKWMCFHLPLSCWAFPLDVSLGWRHQLTAHLPVGFTWFHHSVITYHLLELLFWTKQTEHLPFGDLKTFWCYIKHAVLMMCTLCQLTIVDLLLIVYYLITTTPLNYLHVRWICKTTEWVFSFIITFTYNPKINHSLFSRDYPSQLSPAIIQPSITG